MKNRSSKTILVFFALGLISCALCVQQAQAVPINGVITFAGGAQLNSGYVSIRQHRSRVGWTRAGTCPQCRASVEISPRLLMPETR